MDPEEQARQDIDKMLEASGWIIQDYSNLESALDSVNELRENLKSK